MRPHANLLLLLAGTTFSSLISAIPLPGHYPSHPGSYFQTAYGEDDDINRFNAAIADNGGTDTAHSADQRQQSYTPEEEALRTHIPANLASVPGVREFDEDLLILGDDGNDITNPANDAAVNLAEGENPKPSITADSIPASEIAEDFPEYKEPKTFSTEKIDYSIRTSSSNPHTSTPGQETPSEREGDAGEENSNVVVFSDDKSFHWSGGNGDVLPKNDPEFVKAMGWISGKFGKANGRNPRGKKRVDGNVKENSVFNVFGNL